MHPASNSVQHMQDSHEERESAQASRRSIVFDDIPSPDFADVVIVSIPHEVTAVLQDPAWWAKQVFNVESAPNWVKLLLGLRQTLVRLIGVSPAQSSVFDVDRVQNEEALIAADDRHLDFRATVAVDPQARLLYVTTAVQLHGWRGRLYFLPVSVLHAPVTRSMAKRAVSRAFEPA